MTARIAGGVGADAVERPLAQGQNAGHSDQQLQAHREDGADQREAEDVQPIGIVLDERKGAKEASDDEAGDHSRSSCQTCRPALANRPMGANSRITMRTIMPTASL